MEGCCLSCKFFHIFFIVFCICVMFSLGVFLGVLQPTPSMQPNFISNDSLLNSLRWRYATKKFDPTRKISSADWATLEEALVLSPSAFGIQPWKFIVISDQATKEALVPHSWGQRQVADCSHLVVFAYKKEMEAEYIDRYLQRIVDVRGVAMEYDMRGIAGHRYVPDGGVGSRKI